MWSTADNTNQYQKKTIVVIHYRINPLKEIKNLVIGVNERSQHSNWVYNQFADG